MKIKAAPSDDLYGCGIGSTFGKGLRKFTHNQKICCVYCGSYVLAENARLLSKGKRNKVWKCVHCIDKEVK